MPLRPDMVLHEGATIKTGPSSQVDLQINGRTSVIRLKAGTTLTLKKMQALGDPTAADTDTAIEVAVGEVVGTVKKISGDSSYVVSTPRGRLSVRGTDFSVVVTKQAPGSFAVTFTCLIGEVICRSMINVNRVPTPVTKILMTGQSWTPPE